jgi:hypothetical protein
VYLPRAMRASAARPSRSPLSLVTRWLLSKPSNGLSPAIVRIQGHDGVLARSGALSDNNWGSFTCPGLERQCADVVSGGLCGVKSTLCYEDCGIK